MINIHRLNIVIATDGLPFSGDTLDKRALGGSESAVVYVAREMAKMGHYVRVYCNCDNPGVFGGVFYRHNKELTKFNSHSECDVLIVSRHFNYFSIKYNSKLNILWNHDICSLHDQLSGVMWNIDFMWCLSEYHKKDYVTKNAHFEPHIKIASNGFDPSLVVKGAEKKHKIMFTSRPERGLLKALEIYEKLNDKTLEFLVCNYETIDVPQVRQMEQISLKHIQRLSADGFPIKIGRFTKKELYKHIAESKAVLYPTQFPEIFCINAIEAQANGTVFITSDGFALSETVGYSGVKLDEKYDVMIGGYLKTVLDDGDGIRTEREKLGLEHVKKYQWSNVVLNMMDNIYSYLEDRSQDKQGILKRLIYDSDLILAEQYAKDNDLNFDSSMLDHLRKPEKYTEIYDDEETHEQGYLNIDECIHNPRLQWLHRKCKQHEIKTMLDYACHTGTNALFSKLDNERLNVTGYDISKKAVKQANKRLDNQFPKLKDSIRFIDTIPDEKKYDALHLGEILEHVENPDDFLNDLEAKYCKKGGKVFITLPRGAWEYLTICQNKPIPARYHVHSFDIDDIVSMFSDKPDFTYETTHFTKGYYGEPLGHYMISYTADYVPLIKFKNNKKLTTCRPYQDISLCVIAHNSEKTIETMLDSVYDSVDSIHIALDHDMGENKTLEQRIVDYDNNNKIKMNWTPKRIVSDQWGFANGRNFSVGNNYSKWILWIDADEELILRDDLHKFLDSPFCNAFAIAQHHQQLDSFIPADLPNRLYRTEKGKFYGYIHEQVMDAEDMNKCIMPSMKLDCADITNRGELTETIRRAKALGRNLGLLEKDAKINVDEKLKSGEHIRKLTPILIMRDFVNRIKWSAEQAGTYRNQDSLKHSLPKIISLFKQFYANETEPLYRNEALKQVREALILTGEGQTVAIQVGTDKDAHNIKTGVIHNSKIQEFKKICESFF